MTTYKQIVCTDQVPSYNPPCRAKIVSVGIGNDPALATEKVSLAEVVRQIGAGVIFYTFGQTSGKTALVEKYWCPSCKEWHIRSTPDAVQDNNLDSLRYCHWQKAA